MATTNDQIETFDLALSEHPVRLLDKKTKEPVDYVIREMDGRQRDAYLNGVSKRTRTSAEGVTRVVNFDGLQGDLLTRCMYRVDTDTLVKLEEVQSWPAKVQSKLFDKARELSALNKEEGEDEDKEGND